MSEGARGRELGTRDTEERRRRREGGRKREREERERGARDETRDCGEGRREQRTTTRREESERAREKSGCCACVCVLSLVAPLVSLLHSLYSRLLPTVVVPPSPMLLPPLPRLLLRAQGHSRVARAGKRERSMKASERGRVPGPKCDRLVRASVTGMRVPLLRRPPFPVALAREPASECVSEQARERERKRG